MPIQDRHVEHGIVSDSDGVVPVKLVEPLLSLRLSPTEPLRLTTIHLHRYPDNLE